MKASLKVLILITSLLMGPALHADLKPLDLLPWPWGSECPFPWTTIEGEWVVRSKDASQERFLFEVTQTWDNGTKVLEVSRFDQTGSLIGVGKATAPRGERVIRAVMTGVGPNNKGIPYWILVRTYVERLEKRKKSCTRGKLVTVITIRSRDGQEVHLIVDKEDSEPGHAKP